MKRRSIVVILLVAFAAVAAAEPCAYQLGRNREPGPEITGNYARPYLYSPDTRRWYSDPMYYVACDALRRWHRMSTSCRTAAPRTSARQKRVEPTIEK